MNIDQDFDYRDFHAYVNRPSFGILRPYNQNISSIKEGIVNEHEAQQLRQRCEHLETQAKQAVKTATQIYAENEQLRAENEKLKKDRNYKVKRLYSAE